MNYRSICIRVHQRRRISDHRKNTFVSHDAIGTSNHFDTSDCVLPLTQCFGDNCLNLRFACPGASPIGRSRWVHHIEKRSAANPCRGNDGDKAWVWNGSFRDPAGATKNYLDSTSPRAHGYYVQRKQGKFHITLCKTIGEYKSASQIVMLTVRRRQWPKMKIQKNRRQYTVLLVKPVDNSM